MKDAMYLEEEEEEKDQPNKSLNLTENFNNWPPKSRIIRVSRATGGKDRHSKVLTSKGELRDRRVRLSVGTAIQLYDLQERLGYDQPSKAVEWLLKAASSSIDELPRINNNGPLFQDTKTTYYEQQQPQFSDEKSSSRSDNNVDMEVITISAENNGTVMEDSAGLSLSRSESRVSTREERAKEKELPAQEEEEKKVFNNDNGYLGLKPIIMRQGQGTSFFYDQLLSGGSSMNQQQHVVLDNNNNIINNINKQWDNYFTSLMMGQHGDNLAITGFNGGTLQSNSCPSSSTQSFAQSQLLLGFFNGISSMPVESSHLHRFVTGFDSQLQMCYGNNAHAGNGMSIRSKERTDQ